MAAPDFPQSRRQLRRARIQDALGLAREGVNVSLHRNRLLEQLVVAAGTRVEEFDSRTEDVTDTVVSLALTELDESAPDALLVVLLCVAVLADDGQFARLALLSGRLRVVVARLELPRPFLWTAVEALSLALEGSQLEATRVLQERLGLNTGTAVAEPMRRTRETLSDLLAAASLRAALQEQDSDFAQRARQAALATSDGLLLAFLDAVVAWAGASTRARPSAVLTSADASFESDDMQRYLRRRRIPTLFAPQILAIKDGATQDVDKVIALPTSSGKTLLAEFRIAAALSRSPGSRVIYVAPYRLLARQVERSLKVSLGATLDLRVRDLGSGYDPSADFAVEDDTLEDVVICTPERLDALLRLAASDRVGSAGAKLLFDSSRLLIFDELQLVGRTGRGPRFEMVLARMRARYPDMKFLGLSAANQGADDLAEWLTGDEPILGARRPTGTLEILWETDGSMRQRVSGGAPTTVGTLRRGRSKAIDDAASLLLRLNARYQPALAVMVSRQNAESLAKKIVAMAPTTGAEWRVGLTRSQRWELATAIEEVRALLGDEHPLAHCMENGVAFHHAGVPTQVLQQIERLAAARLMRVVCATTTVAEGADLPFRVVVIPHLNFPGSGRLERDLYLNIIGRAGRANVSVEGVVFVLGTDAPTLKDLVRGSLWSNTTRDRVRGRLAEVGTTLSSAEQWNAYLDVQGQVMGWLGDSPENHVADQPLTLARATFTYASGTAGDRAAVVELFRDAMEDLEERGLAVSASPYRLTPRGRTACLTGLSAPSVARLERAIERGRHGWLRDLVAVEALTREWATQVARLLLESIEVFETSLWFRRAGGRTEPERFQTLWAFGAGNLADYRQSHEFEADVDLAVGWMLGESYASMAAKAPTYERANTFFGGSDASKRTSDATEYVGRFSYPATWVWSAVKILCGDLGDALPGFVKSALAYGVPTAGSAWLIEQGSLTRPAALAVAASVGSDVESITDWLRDEDSTDVTGLGLTRLDAARLAAMRERQE